MPIYTYFCRSCGHELERICKYEERLQEVQCPGCGNNVRWQGLELPTFPKDRPKMGAIMSNGDRVVGHFGKEAKRRRKPKS